jgi:hypothetical protein
LFEEFHRLSHGRSTHHQPFRDGRLRGQDIARAKVADHEFGDTVAHLFWEGSTSNDGTGQVQLRQSRAAAPLCAYVTRLVVRHHYSM